MDGLLANNSLVKQAEQQIEKNVKPDMREAYNRIVAAGLKVALNKGPNGLLASLKASNDPVTDAVNGAIGIVGVLRRESKGTMPVEAMIPATMTLILQALDFLERVGVMKIGKAEVDQATSLMIETLLPKLGLTANKIQGLAQQVQGIVNDPAKMAQLKAGGGKQ